MDVVIVSQARLGGIYRDNRRWATQFVAFDSANRALIELRGRNLAEAAVDATERAARMAGASGRVIYVVGHGGASDDQSGIVDLAPRRQLRISQLVAFDDCTSQDECPDFRAVESTIPRRRRAQRAWCRTSQRVTDRSECSQIIRLFRERRRVQPYYNRIARIFQANRVSRVVFLTCNIGNATMVLDEISTDFNVSILAYRRRVMSGEDSGGQIRMFLEGDAEGHGTNTERARTEIPTEDSYIARPRLTPRLRSRTPRVPQLSEPR
jgi:hypothetical protein